MNLGNLVPIGSTATDDVQALAERFRAAEDQDLQQAASDFESVFISMVLKEMRQTLTEDGLFASENSDSYGAIFDLYMGQHLAQSSGLGIGKMIDTYLESTNSQ